MFESQLPLYFAEVRNRTIQLNASETLYTLWIGTNDVGVNSLLVGQGGPSATVVNTTRCAVSWIKTLYDSGARNFLDDPAAEDHSVLSRLLSESLLDIGAQHYRMECVHDRDDQRWQCVVKSTPRAACATAARSTSW